MTNKLFHQVNNQTSNVLFFVVCKPWKHTYFIHVPGFHIKAMQRNKKARWQGLHVSHNKKHSRLKQTSHVI